MIAVYMKEQSYTWLKQKPYINSIKLHSQQKDTELFEMGIIR
jgi:hypothetical protein